MTSINWQANGSYQIVIDRLEATRFAQALRRPEKPARVHVIFDPQVYALHHTYVNKTLKRLRIPATELVLPGGEKSKTLNTARKVIDILIQEKVSRDELLIAVGGGVTTDLVGLVAAVLLRGVSWSAVPTTLLGMVDSAIGGKTGVNHDAGKNLIGAFWHPQLVWCDPHFLATLSRRELVSGYGEVLKYAGLIGGTLHSLLRDWLQHDLATSSGALRSIIARSAAYKADVVNRDDRDRGPRLVLNFGHTFGHAIEKALGYGRLLHGEAVVIGIAAALELVGRVRPDSAPKLSDYRSLVHTSLTLLPRRKIDSSAVLSAMGLDKKRRGGKSRFVLLKAPGEPFIAEDIEVRHVRAAIEAALTLYADYGGSHGKNPGR
jgi:3-dehydroquinate synthase